MKLHALILACTASLLASPAYSDSRISLDFFQDSLAPYGDWSETDRYGLVWQPSGVDRDWSPYTDGYWSYTDAGWTWVSYEDFGGITYHYGRWVQLDEAGWCWVPGYDWGPAWVSWRRSDDYVGWAPLPPEARWEVKVGISSWSDTHYDVGPGWYSFCRSRDFGSPVIRHVVVPRSRNVTIINVTNNITNITYNHDGGYVFNGGLDYDYIAPRCSRSLPTLKLVQQTNNIFVNGNRGNVFINTQRGNSLYVAAPERAENNWDVATKTPAIRNVYKAPAISRGWAGMDKDGGREKLLMKMRSETNGATPESAPARAFRSESIASVPKKADPTLPRPSVLKAGINRDDRNNDDGSSILKKPIARPMTPEPGNFAKEDDRPQRPSTLKPPTSRPQISANQDRDDVPGILKKPTVRPEIPAPTAIKKQADEVRPPQRPPTFERPTHNSDLRKKFADQEREKSDSAERARDAAMTREKANRELSKQHASDDLRRKQADAQRVDESARRKQADAQDQQRRAADAEKMQRKQAEVRSRSAEVENLQRNQAAETQRRAAQDNARQSQEDAARRAAAANFQRQAEMARRSSDEARQRQAANARQQVESAMRKQQSAQPSIQRPTAPSPNSSRTLTPEQQAELLKKKKGR